MVATAQQNGWKGIIINGVVRNAEQLKTMSFGVKAIGAHPSLGQQMNGQKVLSLSFGGVTFTSGSWVYVDKVSLTNLFVSCSFDYSWIWSKENIFIELHRTVL
jgi:regulator of RNase E activity RraA